MSVVIFDNAIILNTKKMKYYLKQEQIIYAESAGKKVIIHTVDDKISIYGAMKELSEKLGGFFYRCHRAYLVNMEHIVSCEDRKINMDNGDVIYV